MPENRPQKSSYIHWVIGAFPYVIMIGYLGSLRFMALRSSNDHGSPVHITELKTVKARTHLTFPSQAVLEDSYEQQSGKPYWFIARVRLPISQVPALLALASHSSDWHNNQIDFQFQYGFRVMRECHWPTPSFHKFQSARLKAIDDPTSGSVVLVDQDNPQYAIVYLYRDY